ncbi:MAG: DUF362 domain-containing protein [Deltaproteobacteria bacterium]|nr:DUF362 domain-containing protein [Deltaproteobacteria bacterium]
MGGNSTAMGVAIVYGNDVTKMVERLILSQGALGSLRPDDTVVIKPNLVVSRQEWAGVDTDPRIVEALVKVLKERGVRRITVADGSGMGYSATRAFHICGYRDLSRRYGLKLVDLEKDRFVEREVAIDGPFETMKIAATVTECDFLINLPVMKAHSETLLTCSLKNLKGVMPREMKTAFHRMGLHRGIAQLASVLLPDLILVDGLQGDLSSETGRNPVAMETMILGTNPVEVDSVVADILGYAPRTIRHIAHSADAGLGTCDLEKISIRRLNRPSKDTRFAPPPHFTKRFPCRISSHGACCTCVGNLIFALERLQEKGLLSRRLHFLVGQGPGLSRDRAETSVAVGRCAAREVDADLKIDECPPGANAIYRRVAAAGTRD